MAFNRKAKLRDNIEAIRTAFELGKAGRAATPEERERLACYCGFGVCRGNEHQYCGNGYS